MRCAPASSVDEYIASCPKETHAMLKQLRTTLRTMIPQAEEKICYGIPTYKLFRNLVHFGGYKTHIGFYPGSAAIRAFSKKLKGYKLSTGTVQFPLDAPLPMDIIREIVQFRVDQEMKNH